MSWKAFQFIMIIVNAGADITVSKQHPGPSQCSWQDPLSHAKPAETQAGSWGHAPSARVTCSLMGCTPLTPPTPTSAFTVLIASPQCTQNMTLNSYGLHWRRLYITPLPLAFTKTSLTCLQALQMMLSASTIMGSLFTQGAEQAKSAAHLLGVFAAPLCACTLGCIRSYWWLGQHETSDVQRHAITYWHKIL